MADLRDDQLVLNRFLHHCLERPDATFLTQPLGEDTVRDYTFSEVLGEAKRMAAYLDGLALPTQSKIAMISRNCAHFFMADLAIWMAGHVSVALHPTLDDETVSYILAHSDAQLLFVGRLDGWEAIRAGVPARLPQIALPLAPPTGLPTWDEITATHPPLAEETTRDMDDQALILYTSGSTGRPKGVLHSFRTISAPCRGMVALLGINETDRVLSYLPLAHAMDRWLSECIGFYAGTHVFFTESRDTFLDDLKRARPTLFVSVPRLWQKFQMAVFEKIPPQRLDFLLGIPGLSHLVRRRVLARMGLDCVRFAGSGSAPISADLLAWYRDLGLELLEGYGMSENFNYSHLTMPGRGRPGYIGHPYEDVICKLSDVGEILVKSPGNMVGYYKDRAGTAAAYTEDGYLKTGDRGEMDADGRLKVVGRIKEIFKTSKGRYITPAPIENLLNSDPAIALSLVDGSGYVAPYAVVQLADPLLPLLAESGGQEKITTTLDAALRHVNSQLEHYEKLQFLVVAREPWTIEGGQLTPTMKIKRAAIEGHYEDQLEGWYASGERVIWEGEPVLTAA